MRASSKVSSVGWPVGGLGEVADVDRDRRLGAVELRLPAKGRAPRARLLRRPREIVADEHPDMPSGPLHLPGARVRMVQRRLERDELQPEQPARHVEGGLDHRFEAEVRLDLRLVDVVLAALPDRRVAPPVPGRQRVVDPLLAHQLLEPQRVGLGLRPRRSPDRHQQVAHRLRGLGHLAVELEGGEVRIAEQPRALLAQAPASRRRSRGCRSRRRRRRGRPRRGTPSRAGRAAARTAGTARSGCATA